MKVFDSAIPGAAATFVLLLLALCLAAPSAAQEVGVMVEVVEQVTGTPAGGSPAPLAVADPVLLDMQVATGRASYAGIALGDTGSLKLGAETRLVVDRALVDQATGASDSLLSVLVGKVRLAVSSAFRGLVEIDTPTATIGVKGTILTTAVDALGDTVVWVVEGVVEVTSKATGETIEVEAGELTTVSRGRSPTPPTPFDPETGVAAVRTLPPPFTAPQEELLDSPLEPVIDDLPPDRDDPSGQEFRQGADGPPR